MPALTVKAVTKALSDYVRPDEDIVAKLNMVMPRLYAMGMWRDLLYDWSIETTKDYFTLPEHSDSLLGAMLQNSPVEAQSQWHDYRISGYASDGPAPIFGIVDDGFHPTKEEISYPSSAYTISIKAIPIPSTDQQTNATIQLPSDGEVTIDMVEGQNRNNYNIPLSGGSSSEFIDTSELIEIKNISYYGIPDKIRIVAEVDPSDDTATTTTLAEIKGDGVARYRRFRFHNSDSSTKNVKLLLKRAWEPVLTQDDIMYLGNLNAIKHGLLGMLAEDNADLERAQYHWTICRQLLDEELDATRGAAKPKVTLKPAGNNFNTPNII